MAKKERYSFSHSKNSTLKSLNLSNKKERMKSEERTRKIQKNIGCNTKLKAGDIMPMARG